MTEIIAPIRAETGRKESGRLVESVFKTPGLEPVVTLQTINLFCEANDHLRVALQPEQEKRVTFKKANDKGIETTTVFIPKDPTLEDLLQVISIVDRDQRGPSQARQMVQLGGRFEVFSRYLYQIAKKKGKLEEDPSIGLICQSLVKLSSKLKGEPELDQIQIQQKLEKSDPQDPEFDFNVWFLLGGRESAAYKRLYTSYRRGKMEKPEFVEKRNALVSEIETLEQKTNNAFFFLKQPLRKQTEQKMVELLKTIAGPDFSEFENYLKSKQNFLEGVVLTYIGGQKTTEAIVKNVTEAVRSDMQQAIWERGMHFATVSLKGSPTSYEALNFAKDLFSKVSSDPNVAAYFQNRIDALPNIVEKVGIEARLAELQDFRQQFAQGNITRDILVGLEKKWLESIHGSFKIAYALSDKFTPIAMQNEAALKCVQQTMVHGDVLMRGFGVYDTHTPKHRSLLVQKSDGTYTHFDNSGGSLVHISPNELPPYSIENGLRANLTTQKFIPEAFKFATRGKIKLVEYFVESCLASTWVDVDPPSNTKDSMFAYRFFRDRAEASLPYNGGFGNELLENLALDLYSGEFKFDYQSFKSLSIAYRDSLTNREKRIFIKQAIYLGKEAIRKKGKNYPERDRDEKGIVRLNQELDDLDEAA